MGLKHFGGCGKGDRPCTGNVAAEVGGHLAMDGLCSSRGYLNEILSFHPLPVAQVIHSVFELRVTLNLLGHLSSDVVGNWNGSLKNPVKWATINDRIRRVEGTGLGQAQERLKND